MPLVNGVVLANFATMMVRLLSILAAAATIGSVGLRAQTELGGPESPGTSWALLSLQRTWTPQRNDYPNWGIGAMGFTSISENNRLYMGIGLLGTGVERRDAIALLAGPGYFIAGDGKLGLFTYLQAGIVMSAQNGITGFNPFGDETLRWGLAAASALGGCIEVAPQIRIQAALVANVYNMEGGRSPYGVQIGLSTGGR